MPSALIVFEGIDNAGKTTQVAKLGNRLESKRIPHLITRELTTPIGRVIHSYLGKLAFTPVLKTLLFAADRMQRLEQDVEPALSEGKIVLADRWILSAVAYRSVEGLDSEYVLQVNSTARSADMTILIDVPTDEAWRRGVASNRPCPYPADFLEEVREVYLQLTKEFEIPIVNGLQSATQVHASIRKAISADLGIPL